MNNTLIIDGTLVSPSQLEYIINEADSLGGTLGKVLYINSSDFNSWENACRGKNIKCNVMFDSDKLTDCLIMDTVAMLVSMKDISGYILAGGYKNYRYLVERLREYGKRVYLFTDESVSTDLCDGVYSLDGGKSENVDVNSIILDLVSNSKGGKMSVRELEGALKKQGIDYRGLGYKKLTELLRKVDGVDVYTWSKRLYARVKRVKSEASDEKKSEKAIKSFDSNHYDEYNECVNILQSVDVKPYFDSINPEYYDDDLLDDDSDVTDTYIHSVPELTTKAMCNCILEDDKHALDIDTEVKGETPKKVGIKEKVDVMFTNRDKINLGEFNSLLKENGIDIKALRCKSVIRFYAKYLTKGYKLDNDSMPNFIMKR